MPSRVLFHVRPFLGIGGMVPHHLVRGGFDFSLGNEAGKDRALDQDPADANHDGRHCRRDRQPFQCEP